MMFSLRPVLKSLALLVFLVPSLSVFAEQEEKGDDSSLMTNYNALREEGQGFYLENKSILFEKPDSVKIPVVLLYWWCDLEFLSDEATNSYGYVGRAVEYFLGSSLEDLVAQGAQISTKKSAAFSVSAVMVPTLGIFEGQIHKTNDDLVLRYWDDGSSTHQLLGWEGHDEGDTSPNKYTSAFAAIGTVTKITTAAAAELLGMDVADMTPDTCSMEYEAAWNATNVPDPIDASVTTAEENNAQLQADIKELMSRIDALEGSGSGDDGDPTSTSSSLFMAWYEHDTMDIVMKSIMTVATIIGLVAIDFI
jgi:hypothetical protein